MNPHPLSVLANQACHNKLPKIEQRKATEMYFLTIQESEIKVSVELVPSGSSEEKLSHASLSLLTSEACRQSLTFPGSWQQNSNLASVFTLPSSVCSSLKGHQSLDLGLTLNLILTTYICKAPKITFLSSRWTRSLGGHLPTTLLISDLNKANFLWFYSFF